LEKIFMARGLTLSKVHRDFMRIVRVIHVIVVAGIYDKFTAFYAVWFAQQILKRSD